MHAIILPQHLSDVQYIGNAMMQMSSATPPRLAHWQLHVQMRVVEAVAVPYELHRGSPPEGVLLHARDKTYNFVEIRYVVLRTDGHSYTWQHFACRPIYL